MERGNDTTCNKQTRGVCAPLHFCRVAGPIAYPAFYSYSYPTPEGFSEVSVKPDAAFHSKELGEFLRPYDEVPKSASPGDTLLDFPQPPYEAAANLGKWDRASLERTYDSEPTFKG